MSTYKVPNSNLEFYKMKNYIRKGLIGLTISFNTVLSLLN
jgi:hypothetical protein